MPGGAVLEFVRENKVITGIASVALLAVILIFAGMGSDEDPLPAIGGETTTTILETDTTTDDSGIYADIALIDCRTLLTIDEFADALGVWDRAPGEQDSIGSSRGEVCSERVAVDETHFVRVEPGDPGDFDTGAIEFGVPGQAVPGVGDKAFWFGGPDADQGGDVGMLSVLEATEIGVLVFRIVLGRPDLEQADQLEIAVGLARRALPRFPGVRVDQGEPEVVTFDEEAPDQLAVSLIDNLTAKVEAGEWTVEEGLTATLGFMGGERPRSDVTSHEEFEDPSATPVIEQAIAYLETGGAQTARDEISRLLDRLLLARDELDEMSQPSLSATGLLVSILPVAQEEGGGGCNNFSMKNPCVQKVPIPPGGPALKGEYSLYAALGDESNWTEDDLIMAIEALEKSGATYEALGDMPAKTTVVLQPGGEHLYVSHIKDDCVVFVDDFLGGSGASEFRQLLAREIGFCLIGETFRKQLEENLSSSKWWTRGLANYLSDIVYPEINFEHKNLPSQLAQQELSTTLAERTWTNWAFFEYLHDQFETGALGNMGMIDTFPAVGDHIGALAAYPGMPELFHDYARELADANVEDVGNGPVPYEPPAWELPLSGPTEVPLSLAPFGVRRLHVVVPAGLVACFEIDSDGTQRSSWRPGVPGGGGEWSDMQPAFLEGDMMLVATSLEEGAEFNLRVTEVDVDPDCEADPDAPPVEPDECDVICDRTKYFLRLITGG